MASPEEITLCWDAGVRAELFEEPLYQAVFNFTIEYWQNAQRKQAPTPWALAQEFPGYTVTDDAEETTEYLAASLGKRFTVNAMQNMMRTATATMFKDPHGALKELHAAAYSASEVVAERRTRVNMADTIDERRELYLRGADYPQGLGVTYGLDLIDLFTGGILPGELAVAGAYAKTGKTMLLLNAAVQAVRKGYKPIVFSLELSLADTQTRLDAMFSGVSYNRLSKRHLSQTEMEKLWAAQGELRDLGGLPVERPEEGERTVADLCGRARLLGCNYLIIDQLSHMEPGRKTEGLKEHHGTIVKQLHNEISRTGVELSCLLAAQLRRDDEEITLQSFANAAEIEREADILVGISRNQDMRNNHLMRLDILGSRRTDNAAWSLIWELTDSTDIRVERQL